MKLLSLVRSMLVTRIVHLRSQALHMLWQWSQRRSAARSGVLVPIRIDARSHAGERRHKRFTD